MLKEVNLALIFLLKFKCAIMTIISITIKIDGNENQILWN